MKRIANALLAVSVGLFAAAPALAAKPDKPSATVTLNQSAPAYGDFIDFKVTTNVSPTYAQVVCSHDGTASYGLNLIHSDLAYVTERTGLFAPNWSSGGATCVATVYLVTAQSSDHWKAIGETGFVVAP